MNRKVEGGNETCPRRADFGCGCAMDGPGQRGTRKDGVEPTGTSSCQVDKDIASLCQMDRADGLLSPGGAWRLES
jgi:hypothetical protein